MPRIINVSGAVIVEDDKILVNKTCTNTQWMLCGGKTEEGETLIETAAREAKEEMGISIKILDTKPYFFYTTKQTSEGLIDIILAHYRAKRIGEIEPGADICAWAWLPILELDELANKGELAPNIIPTLEHFGFI